MVGQEMIHLQLPFLFYYDLLDFKFMQSLIKFLTPASGLQGYWDPYPIDMVLRPPCMVLSTIGISKPGKLEGQSTKQCSTSSTACLITYITTEDTVIISNVTGFFSPGETHPLNAICLETFC
ncbi:hypothetical protein R3W88_032084 [Solanum pinnatisectum]|uniref:Uncharacterized protein n=1 Tax=Solanum pinnatisectum TaxID=50273 RepID=A0AAV9LS31_9SOLN|nr:hypothetical protein R3W88_032084 [Solanum pinnatisectum]